MFALLDKNPLLDGLTLSGGEPLAQPEAAARMAGYAREKGLNVWCYTGSTWEALIRENDPAKQTLLALVDVLVDGPFVQAEKSLELSWRGSRNQRLIDVPRSLAAGSVVLWEPPVR